MTILPAQSETSGPGASQPETATVQQSSQAPVMPIRQPERVEIDAGVVLLGLVFLLLLIIPVTLALFRFRMARRRADAINAPGKLLKNMKEVRHPRDPAVTDPWQESGRRVEVDPNDEEIH
ncbi:MAG: hypothetical protein CMJ67_09745 [Planctomycetaceae bacterium]|nr:hypothetical protein [Planctomycetaceae bacterium]